MTGPGRALPTRRRPAAALGAVALALTLLLSACSGDDAGSSADAASGSGSPSESGSDSGSASPSPTEKPYLPVPRDVSLTEQGSLLAVGQRASVAWRPKKQVNALDLTVTALERTTFAKSFGGWKLSDQTKRTTPYFVRVTVRNVGRSNLSGQRVPLYLLDDKGTLVESSTFAGDFEPCGSTALPKGFTRGERTQRCLVYLAPPGRTLDGVSFRPDQDFEAITWAGEVRNLARQGGGNGGGNSGGGNNSGGGGNNGGGGNDNGGGGNNDGGGGNG